MNREFAILVAQVYDAALDASTINEPIERPYIDWHGVFELIYKSINDRRHYHTNN